MDTMAPHTCYSPQLLTHPQGLATFGEILLLLTSSTEVHSPTLLDCAPRRAFLPTQTLPCPLVYVSMCPQAQMLMCTCLRATGKERGGGDETLEGTCWRRDELKDLAASWPCRFPSGELSPCRLFYLCLFVCLPVLLHLLMCLSLSRHMLLGWSQRFRDKLSLPPPEARHAHARTQQKQLLGLTALHSLHSSSPRTCLIISLPVPKGV